MAIDNQTVWSELNYKDWAPTKKTLQMCCQMLGKVRLALSPPLPEWMHTCLYLDEKGFTTGLMPYHGLVLDMGVDVFASEMWVSVIDGRSLKLSIGPNKRIADIWKEFRAGLKTLKLDIPMFEKPQEVADLTPFSENTHDCTFVAEQAQSFYGALANISTVFEEFRSDFFGRSCIQFWWGAFDLSVVLYTGKKEQAPENKGYVNRYHLDAQHMNVSFWPGDDSVPNAGFYAYLYPRPDGCETAPVKPEYASWVKSMGEWMMTYDSVRNCDDPRQAILDFLKSVYEVAITKGGWDKESYEYTKPALSPLAKASIGGK